MREGPGQLISAPGGLGRARQVRVLLTVPVPGEALAPSPLVTGGAALGVL